MNEAYWRSDWNTKASNNGHKGLLRSSNNVLVRFKDVFRILVRVEYLKIWSNFGVEQRLVTRVPVGTTFTYEQIDVILSRTLQIVLASPAPSTSLWWGFAIICLYNEQRGTVPASRFQESSILQLTAVTQPKPSSILNWFRKWRIVGVDKQIEIPSWTEESVLGNWKALEMNQSTLKKGFTMVLPGIIYSKPNHPFSFHMGNLQSRPF